MLNIKLSFLAFLACSVINSCQTHSFEEPQPSLEKYTLEKGFELQLAASEPLLNAPITLDFDDKGRIWVVEMPSYMPNLAGAGEDQPTGRIIILEDLDKDGVADHSKIFLDSLVLPRAIAHVYGGLLYAEPPNLWFVEIEDDKPGKRTLVDSLYSDGGNVEMQPNGLLMNLDNWIYNAKANFRYRLKNGRWEKEPTVSRGQWGIAKDNMGRLYYNNNTVQLIGDYALPMAFIRNPYFRPKQAVDVVLTDDQRVYPLHPTTVNRGGEKGTLNKDSLLVAFTAACGPVIYRGDNFPAEYEENAFACEPEANLVKRNILHFEGGKTIARQAWTNKEFLASTDEQFRPVNLFNGPDGALYIVDMHRGVMQHKAYITPYYESQAAFKKLDTVLGMGRILRVKNERQALTPVPAFDKLKTAELVGLLQHANGWIRDRAQQTLIRRRDVSVVPALTEMSRDDKNDIAAVHAMHTLDGLGALSFPSLRQALAKGNGIRIAHTLTLMESFATAENSEAMSGAVKELLARKDSVVNLYVALALGPWVAASQETFLPILQELSDAYAGHPVYQEAIISSIGGMEEKFRSLTPADNKSKMKLMDSLLVQTLKNRKEDNKNPIYVQVSNNIDERTSGLTLFRSTCAACHGADGSGLENLAPPLKGSQYVSGSVDKLAMIILHGLEGPIHVNGKLYQLNGAMPGFAHNFTDKQIADIITFLHNAYVTEPRSASVEKITRMRNKRTKPLTEKELLQTPDTKD